MKLAWFRPFRTSWRFGSVTVLSVPMTGDRAVGGVELLSELAFVTLLRNGRKSTASGGAFLPTAMPLPPPTPSVGAPAPPVTAGNGNHPRSVPRPFLLVLSATSTPGAHWPISSIAALPLPTAAASLSYDALL